MRYATTIGIVEKHQLTLGGTIMDNEIIDELEATYSEELTLLTDDLGAMDEAVKAKMH